MKSMLLFLLCFVVFSYSNDASLKRQNFIYKEDFNVKVQGLPSDWTKIGHSTDLIYTWNDEGFLMFLAQSGMPMIAAITPEIDLSLCDTLSFEYGFKHGLDTARTVLISTNSSPDTTGMTILTSIDIMSTSMLSKKIDISGINSSHKHILFIHTNPSKFNGFSIDNLTCTSKNSVATTGEVLVKNKKPYEITIKNQSLSVFCKQRSNVQILSINGKVIEDKTGTSYIEMSLSGLANRVHIIKISTKDKVFYEKITSVK